jgi:pantetheine-phosphate adenylyltransferase
MTTEGPLQRIVVYPGTFDPITNGHLDVAARAAAIFDEVIVGVAGDSTKHPLFTLGERVAMAQEAIRVAGLDDRVQVRPFQGLLVNFARDLGARAIVRGLRAVSDFEFEFQLALMNRKLNDSVETIFLMPRGAYTYLSSSIIKEISRLDGPISTLVPRVVEDALRQKWTALRK